MNALPFHLLAEIAEEAAKVADKPAGSSNNKTICSGNNKATQDNDWVWAFNSTPSTHTESMNSK